MGAEHEEAQYLQVVFFTDFPYCKEIPQGFGHFLIINIQECVVHPVVGKGLAVRALALRDLIFMVRENQILPTGMNIDFLTQIFFAITEHSMCHPGRPSPHGDTQKGSPSFFGFHRTKSSGSSF